MLKTGDMLGVFEIVELVGKGGMGEVYRARDTKLGRDVAIKVLPESVSKNAELLSRFEREARLLASLNHPNIATIHDFHNEDEKHFLVMELIGGETLAEYIERGPVSDSRTIELFLQMAWALNVAHKAGVVHRDLKPDNVKIDEGQIKILDFGLAKDSIQQPQVHSPNTPTVRMSPSRGLVTEAGMVMGTPMYMSPEQARGKDMDQRTDIWAFGCCFYEALTGDVPFNGDTAADILGAVLEREPDFGLFPKKTPRGLIAIIRSCLAKNPEDRPASMEDVAHKIQHVLEPVHSGQGMSGLVKVGIAVALLAVVAVIGAMVAGDKASKKIEIAAPIVDEDLLPRVLLALDNGDTAEAFSLAEKLDKQDPDNEILATLWDRMSRLHDVQSEPPGVTVYIKKYHDESDVWVEFGTTPFERRIPFESVRIKFELDGYGTRVVAKAGLTGNFNFELLTYDISIRLRENDAPFPEMINVEVESFSVPLAGFNPGDIYSIPEYLIDLTEVTNRKYKEFVDAGGYSDPQWWQYAFELDGETLSFQEAVERFEDKVGRTGPAGWELGDYPEGEDDFPVGGVSWYETSAYAAYRGKALPSIFHWAAALFTDVEAVRPLVSDIMKTSNMDTGAPEVVGRPSTIGSSGALNMGGNQREWCFNEARNGRHMFGGSWDDQQYMLLAPAARSPRNRELANGFRCAVYSDENPPSKDLFTPHIQPLADFSNAQPLSDAVFDTLVTAALYDAGPLEAVTEAIDTSDRNWDVETVVINGVDGSRMKIELFMPKEKRKSQSSVIFFPGSDATVPGDFNVLNYIDQLRFMIKSGRVIIVPHYRELWENSDGTVMQKMTGLGGANIMRKWVQDITRTLEFIESRDDIRNDDPTYAGVSLGAIMGTYILPYVQDKFSSAILISGGLSPVTGANAPPFLMRITLPTLMINGDKDYLFPVETLQKPMFDFIGTPAEHKKHIVIDAGHMPKSSDLAKVSMEWLDRYQPQTLEADAGQ